MGNAGDVILVQLNAHLLAWPRDLGNLSVGRMSSSFLFVEGHLVKLAFFVTLYICELLQLYNNK